MNMNNKEFGKKVGTLLALFGNPFRIQIIMAIGLGEVCVCHLETVLKKRQSYISQHLMEMRDAGILETRREGKYIYYRIANTKIFDLLRETGLLAGMKEEDIPLPEQPIKSEKCVCPHCVREAIRKSVAL